jgi:tetratricopeptide (TPR) repeat protein
MPYTMNGIGTWYYGKKNLFNHADFCPHCGRHVTLSSYDTREWFVIVFIPILPLGRKRIMDSCPVCTKHRQMSLKKYLTAKKAAYDEAEQKYNAAPNDIEAAGQMLQVYAAYEDMKAFDELAPRLLEQFQNDARLFNTVGMIQFQYGRMEPAQDCFEQSLLLADDDTIRYMLGLVSIRLSDPDAAARYFQFIVDKGVHEKAPSLLILVDAYQAQGRHQEALNWLDQAVEIDPALAQNKEYKKSRKLSEKNLATGKPIKSKQFHSAQREKTPLSGAKAWAIAAGVLLVIGLALAGTSFYMGQRANVYLVNGLDRPYEVAVGTKTITLPARGHQKAAIPEGELTLTVTDADLAIPPCSLTLHSPFWKRPFLSQVYVINPDTIALVEWVKVFYHENTSKAPDPQWELHYGQPLYVFNGVQFPFRELPDQIKSEGGGAQSRVQVKLVDPSDVLRDQMPSVVEQYFGFEAKIGYLKKILCYDPDNLMHLTHLLEQADAAMFLEAVQPGLEAMPLRVEWHRLYQQVMDVEKPEYDLAAEYKARLEKMPDDAQMQYLYGRTLRKDRHLAKFWFERSIQNPKPSPYGYFALGYDAMAAGEFETALGYFQKASELVPDHPYYCNYCLKMFLATGQLDKAETLCQAQTAQKPADYEWMEAHVAVLRQQGKSKEAKQAFEAWCKRNREAFPEEDFAQLQKSDRLSAAYLKGEFKTIEAIVGEPNDIWATLLVTFNGDKPISHDILAQADQFPPLWLLLFYIAETRQGNAADAGIFLSEALKRFQTGGYEERCLARFLEPEAKPDPDVICGLVMDTELKAIALTAMGIRFPEHRERFFALAQRLNFKKEFPYHYLNTVLAGTELASSAKP